MVDVDIFLSYDTWHNTIQFAMFAYAYGWNSALIKQL